MSPEGGGLPRHENHGIRLASTVSRWIEISLSRSRDVIPRTRRLNHEPPSAAEPQPQGGKRCGVTGWWSSGVGTASILTRSGHAVDTFLARHASVIQGVLSGFDRVRFRGTQRWLANERGMRSWLWKQQVLLKDFKNYALGLREQIKQATQQIADTTHRPVQYLQSSSQRADHVPRSLRPRPEPADRVRCPPASDDQPR